MHLLPVLMFPYIDLMLKLFSTGVSPTILQLWLWIWKS